MGDDADPFALHAFRHAAQRSGERGGPARPDRQAIDRLIGQYLGHRKAEEEALLAIVQSVLQPDDLAELGESMAARRGLSWKQLNARAL